MANSTTGNVMTSGGLAELVSRNAIRQYMSKRFFMQFGKEENLPAGYNTFQFTKVDSMAGSSASLTEGTTPSEVAFNLTGVDVSLTQYGAHTILTDVLLSDAPVNVITEAAIELGEDLAEKVDAAYQDTIDAGTNVIYSGSAAARTDLDATNDTISYVDIAKAVSELRANDAPTFDGDMFVCVMHPHVYHDLIVETGTGAFLDANKYTTSDKIFRGEVGALYGARIVVSSNVQFYVDGGTTTTDAYPTYVFGRNAFGHVVSGGMESFIKGLGSGGSDDPLHQRATVGVKTRVGFAILKEEGLQRIESASTLGTNS